MGGAVGDARAFDGFPHAELPALTGAYGVGTVVLPLVDEARLEEMTPDPDDFREIMVQIWYPTDKSASGPTVPYMDLPSLSYLIMQSIGIVIQSGQETDTIQTRNGFMMHLDDTEHLAFMDFKLILSQVVPPGIFGGP